MSEKAKELSPNGLKQMHKELFGELYTWAGSFRDYTTGHGYPFYRPKFIEKEITKVYVQLNKKVHFDINKEYFIKTSAWFIGELNTINLKIYKGVGLFWINIIFVLYFLVCSLVLIYENFKPFIILLTLLIS